MSFNLPDDLILEQEFSRMKRELERAVNEGVTDSQQAPQVARGFIKANAQIVNTDGLAGLLQKVRESESSIPVFDVIFPTEPHHSLLNDIGRWFRSQIHPNALLRISVRSSIGGGIVVRSKNRVFDMSFRPKIIAAKDKMPEVMQRV